MEKRITYKLIAQLPLLLLLLSLAGKEAEAQCGFMNCTNFFRACNTASQPTCICVPMGGVNGTCIYQNLLTQHLNYCQSHSDCVRKGQGDFCMKSSVAGISDFGWCLSQSNQDDSRSVLKLPA